MKFQLTTHDEDGRIMPYLKEYISFDFFLNTIAPIHGGQGCHKMNTKSVLEMAISHIFIENDHSAGI